MFSDVVLKEVEAINVISIREIVPVYCEAWAQWDELTEFLVKHKIIASGPPLTIFHDLDNRARNTDAETCIPVNDSLIPEGRIKAREIPRESLMACIKYQGALPEICAIDDEDNDDPVEQMCEIIEDWIDSNNYRIAGPTRDVYLRTGDAGGEFATIPAEYVTDDPNEFITEVQFPIENK